MEHFVVSARKYRPKTFADVVGQQAITNTLRNAIDNNHLAQALLFCGPRGVGKTSCARILAKQINLQEHQDENEDFAFNIFELDAASNNSVDDIRSLIDQVRIPPQIGSYKIYIIDEVHMLSQAAFNAFLKTLEEPPRHAIFILATTEKHKIIPTILSRCQIFDFKRITVKDAAEYLTYIAKEQGITAEEEALHIIAKKADGAMRDALSIFDRVVSFSGKNLTRLAVTENLNVLDYDTFFKATDLILNNRIPELLLLFNDSLSKGFDGHHFIAGLASHFRDLLVCLDPQTIPLLEVGKSTQKQYIEQSQKANQSFLIASIQKANECDLKYKTSKNQRLLVELCLMQLASITFDGEKKKSKDYIIPAAFFISTHKPKKEFTASKYFPSSALKKNIPDAAPSTIDTNSKKENIKPKTRVSGLSLSSIKTKQEHLKSKQGENIVQENLPADAFSLDDFKIHWETYIEQLNNKGEKILASILTVDQIAVKENAIQLEFPNDTMKVELERAQGPILKFLKSKLNNYSLYFDITVNEETQKKYIFTPKDKYEKLREVNPNIDLLRQEFDLDI